MRVAGKAPLLSARLLWLLPLAALVLAAASAFWTRWEHAWVERNFARAFRAHAESVSRLVAQNARRSAQLLESYYQLLERELELSARLVAGAQDCGGRASDLALCLVEEGGWRGDFGPLPPEQREEFIKLMTASPDGELIEEELLRRHQLFCARFDEEPRHVILCRNLSEISELRRRAGLGRLLEDLEGRGLLYAVIEDDEGVLVAAGDASLARKIPEAQVKEAFRLIDSPRGKIFESRLPFTLPDESPALLRVGLDARPLERAEQQLERRHSIFYLTVLMLVLAVFAGTFWLRRLQEAANRAAEKLRQEEEEKRYYQGLSQLAASVAHEVRNPLNTMKMTAQRLLREFTLPEEQKPEFREMVGVLQGEIERINRVVGEFMELGKPLVLEKKSLDLEKFLEEALLNARLRAEQEGKKLQIKTIPAVVVIDPRRLSQVLSNLVTNALDAVGVGGMVEVEAHLNGQNLVFVVRDNGPGMSPQELEKVGQPFFTTKAQGTGLGLALSRRIVRAHGGEMKIASAKGQGTQVTVTIPQGKSHD